MQELLIKQFLLENGYKYDLNTSNIDDKEYQEKLYSKYISGKLIIPDIDITSWLIRKERFNKRFGGFLRSFKLICDGDEVTEITTDNILSCTQIGNIERHIIINPAGIGYDDDLERKMIRGKLVINGIYLNQQCYIEKALEHHTPFVVGFVLNYDINYNKRLLEYYKSVLEAIKILYPEEDVTEIKGKENYILTYKIKDSYSKQARFPKFKDFASQR